MKWAVASLATLAVVAVVAILSQRGASVAVVPVVRTAIVQSIAATGRLNAFARMDVGSEVTATVLEVHVHEGDRVQQGQLMVRLQDAEATAALQQAQLTGQSTEREYQRAQELFAQGFFAPQKVDDARLARDLAQANVAAARARLARLHIRSPVNALVLARSAEPGSMAQPGKILLSLAAEGGMRIEAAVDEKHLQMLRMGMPARAVVDAYPDQPFDANLSYISPAVDPQRGTVDVRLAVPTPPAFLKPDMTVSVELVGGNHPNALVLPSVAVRDADRDAPWVLALREGVAVKVPVRLGLRGVGAVEISEGVQEGEAVIAQTEKALPGDRVHAKTPAVAGKGMEVPSYIQR